MRKEDKERLGIALYLIFCLGFFLGFVSGDPNLFVRELFNFSSNQLENLIRYIEIVLCFPLYSGSVIGGYIRILLPLSLGIIILCVIALFFLAGIEYLSPYGPSGSSGIRRGEETKEKERTKISKFFISEEERAYYEGYKDYPKYYREEPPIEKISTYPSDREREAYRKGWEDRKKSRYPEPYRE